MVFLSNGPAKIGAGKKANTKDNPARQNLDTELIKTP